MKSTGFWSCFSGRSSHVWSHGPHRFPPLGSGSQRAVAAWRCVSATWLGWFYHRRRGLEVSSILMLSIHLFSSLRQLSFVHICWPGARGGHWLCAGAEPLCEQALRSGFCSCWQMHQIHQWPRDLWLADSTEIPLCQVRLGCGDRAGYSGGRCLPQLKMRVFCVPPVSPGEAPEWPWIWQWLNKIWYICTRELYLAVTVLIGLHIPTLIEFIEWKKKSKLQNPM